MAEAALENKGKKTEVLLNHCEGENGANSSP